MDATATTKENKMGIMPVNQLLISMSLPMMISMLVQALYNIVDSIFVSRINENALTAVSLAFPIQTLMIALGAGTGVGINALLSRSLGEKDYEKANKSAVNGVFLAVVNYVIFLLVGLFVTGPFYLSQTRDAQILEYGKSYLTIVCCCSFGMYAQFVYERLLQSTGKTFYTMITQGVGAIINIILDPIFIFGFFGVPRMGVAGAAVATVIGQIIAGTIALIINEKKNTEIKVQIRGFRPNFSIIKQIYQVGIPSIIMQAIGSVMTYGMNKILLGFTNTAAAAYNYGAGKKDRLIKTVKLSILYAICLMFIGFVVFQIFPAQLLLLFDASDIMLAIGVPALRIISCSFLLAGFCIICGTMFQALGNGVYSMVVSIARQLVVLLPVAYLLSLTGNVTYVWLAFPIAELMSLGLSVFFLIRINNKVIKHIGAES